MNSKTEPTKPKYFYCYLDNETILQHLSDEQAGKLWKMLFTYTNRGEKNNINDPVVSMAFDVMAQQIDRDFEKYREKCEKNRANAYKRNRPLTTANDGSQYKEKDKDKEKDNTYYVEQDTTSLSSEISEIVSYLNECAGTSYKPSTKATQRHITARLNEGFMIEDFKAVIDSKSAEWKDTDMAKYLRPETLFGSKFESYLNACNFKTQSEPKVQADEYAGYQEFTEEYDYSSGGV